MLSLLASRQLRLIASCSCSCPSRFSSFLFPFSSIPPFNQWLSSKLQRSLTRCIAEVHYSCSQSEVSWGERFHAQLCFNSVLQLTLWGNPSLLLFALRACRRCTRHSAAIHVDETPRSRRQLWGHCYLHDGHCGQYKSHAYSCTQHTSDKLAGTLTGLQLVGSHG